jgi:hypothetical protein
MNKSAFFIVPCFLILGCSHTKKNPTNTGKGPGEPKGAVIIENIPNCLRDVLSKIESKQYPDPPLQIDEYLYKGKKVYVHTADCCDQYNVAYDENCKGFCSPSGGIDGKGDRKCSDFKDSARLLRNIWKR